MTLAVGAPDSASVITFGDLGRDGLLVKPLKELLATKDAQISSLALLLPENQVETASLYGQGYPQLKEQVLALQSAVPELQQQGKLAAALGCTAPWISQLLNSRYDSRSQKFDAPQAALWAQKLAAARAGSGAAVVANGQKPSRGAKHRSKVERARGPPPLDPGRRVASVRA